MMKNKTLLITTIAFISMTLSPTLFASTVDFICPSASSFKQTDYYGSEGYYAYNDATAEGVQGVNCPIDGTGSCYTDGVVDSLPASFSSVYASQTATYDGTYNAGVVCSYNNDITIVMNIDTSTYDSCYVSGNSSDSTTGTVSGTDTSYNDGDTVGCSDSSPADCTITCSVISS